MKAIWSALMGAYSRWKYVEAEDLPSTSGSTRKSNESADEEIGRLRQTLARERRNLETFQRFNCAALAGPVESSIRAMESRIRALELKKAV